MKGKLLGICLLISISNLFSQNFRNEWIDYNKTYYKFKVGGFGADPVNVGGPIKKGLVRIPQSALVAAGLGSTPAQHFQIFRNGVEVTLFTSVPTGILGASDYIEFFGECNDGKLDKDLYRDPNFQLSDYWSLQTDTASYFITINTSGTAKRFVETTNNIAGNSLPPTQNFMHTVGRYFRNEIFAGFSVFNQKNLYSSSYDRGEGFTSRRVRPNGNSCGGQAQLPQGFIDLFPDTLGPAMTFNANLVGGANNSRTVRVNMNGETISLFQMDYQFDAMIEESIPVSKIKTGTVSFMFINQSNVDCDEMRISKVELTYPRLFNFGNNSTFSFQVPASSTGHYLKIANFNYGASAPVLMDLTNNKRYVADISIPDTLQIVLEPSTQPYNLALVSYTTSTIQTINNLQQRNFINYANASNQGDYLIISNKALFGNGGTNQVELYRQYRASAAGGNFNAKIVDIDEIEDQFAYGVKKHPLSIRNFLMYARNSFTQTPKFAFLIGKGVCYNDYRNNESDANANALNLVPTWGYPASDNLFTANNITVAIPTIPVGRLSVVSEQEVADYLQKMIAYEQAQQNNNYTVGTKSWMKNVLQIAGGNDGNIGPLIDGYLNTFKGIISDTAFGAKVKTFSKSGNGGNYPQAVADFKDTYESGASLLTYFGHSSATSLDFSLDNPEAYNNAGKYPVFLVNGCVAGDHFVYEPTRFSNKTTISEKFILAQNRGAIGYLASSHFGVVFYLNIFTNKFYNAITKTKYGQSFGDIMKEGIAQAYAQTGTNDYYTRMHAEEYSFHGDPALKLNSSLLPDYIIEQPQITINPSFVSVADDSFAVKTIIYNTGRATKDSLNFRLMRQFPNNTNLVVFTKRIPAIGIVDSITVKLPIFGNRDLGANTITATIDYDAQVTELSEANNTASVTFNISQDEIKPVYPYKYAIVTNNNFKLAASTVNPLAEQRSYKMEIDTTTLFNSPVKYTQTINSKGGVVEFDKGLTLENGKVYYWRVAPADMAEPRWNEASFVYKPTSSEGFEQSHFYQHTQSNLDRVSYDSTSRKYGFNKKVSNLYIQQSIYPTSGLEDNQFSVSLNGTIVSASACWGSSVIYNVFDPLTLKPWENTNDIFGATTTCADNRKYNFEFQATDTGVSWYPAQGGRKGAMDFFDYIPNGHLVVVKRNYDMGDADWAPTVWANDTTFYGSGNSLYHRFKNQGLPIDSFIYPRTFVFVFKKNDPSFTPIVGFSQGLYDRVTLSQNITNTDTLGSITSPLFGPAKAWDKVQWSGLGSADGNDRVRLEVIGVKKDKSEVILHTLDTLQNDFNISSINAATYPNVMLRLWLQDSIKATPYQLNQWRVLYTPAPEGAIAPNLYAVIPDTVFHSAPTLADTLQFKVAFKNVSKVNFDSLSLQLVLYDANNNRTEIPLPKTRPVIAGDTVHVGAKIFVGNYQGLYNMYLMVNPDAAQPEQYLFNNFLFKNVFVYGTPLPVTLVNFLANPFSSGVKVQWQVTNEENFSHYEIEHSADGRSFNNIGKSTAINSGAIIKAYEFYHPNPLNGKNYYRLKMVNKDGSFSYSPVRLVNFGKGIMVNVYPNPVRDKMQISISKTDNKPSAIRIMNMFGQVMLSKSVQSFTEIDTRTWQSGTYVVQVDDGSSLQTFKVIKQ